MCFYNMSAVIVCDFIKIAVKLRKFFFLDIPFEILKGMLF